MTKFISMFTATLMAVLFTLGTVQAQVRIVPTEPPDKCYTAENLDMAEGVTLQVYDMQETIAMVQRYIPRQMQNQLPTPMEVSGSMAAQKVGNDFFVFSFIDNNGCLMPPLILINGDAPQSESNRNA